jgi:hypothetical protein
MEKNLDPQPTPLFQFISKQMAHKPAAFSASHYPELRHFRSKLEDDRCSFQFLPYTVRKKTVARYRATFLALGAIFFVLANATYFKTLSWSCGFLFGTCNFVKGFICSLAGILSLAAFLIGFFMRTEKETIHHHMIKARQKLNNIYLKKKVEFGLKQFFSIEEEHLRRTAALKHAYREIYQKIEEYKEEALFLSEKIQLDGDLTQEQKENLFNQAALEFIRQVESAIQKFQLLTPPKIFEKIGF